MSTNENAKEIQKHITAAVDMLRDDAETMAGRNGRSSPSVMRTLLYPYIKAAMLDAEPLAGGDGRTKEFRVSGTLWDVTDGADNAEDVATAEPETVQGLVAAVRTVAGWIRESFEDEPIEAFPSEAQPATLFNRVSSLRHMLTRGGGKAEFRVKFEIGDETFLLVAPVERID